MNFNDRFTQINRRMAELNSEIDLESKKEAEALRECSGAGRTPRFLALVRENCDLGRQKVQLIKEAEHAVRRAVNELGVDRLITVSISGIGFSLGEIDVWQKYNRS